MAKNKNDYFKLIEEQISYCVKASDLLVEILSGYSLDNISEYRAKMHAIENAADEIHHDILTRLSAEFITPIDQEDILRLVQIVDDITDAIDEVVMDLYMYNLDALPATVPTVAAVVHRCIEALHTASSELKNFKKPAKLREYLIEANSIESEADALYVEAIRALFASTSDAKTLIAGKAIYESLENCCDLCEHASDVIEQIIIKNT